MTPSLILNSNNAANGNLSVDVSPYLDLTVESDMDTYDPGWSNKVISRALLKEGGTLALEARQEKALTFPVKLNSATKSGVLTLVQQINQVLNSEGATYSWQDTGCSQPTVFDSITGELAIKYKYREQERFWVSADLKLYTQPLGRTAGARPYASASAVGPLLMISPYASGGGQIINASAAGYGASPNLGPMGASSGVSYWGSPSLAGDVGAQLQISYVGPSQAATFPFQMLTGAIALLPDGTYNALIPASQVANTLNTVSAAGAVASTYVTKVAGAGGAMTFQPCARQTPPQTWVGLHRLFAIARASSTTASATATLTAWGTMMSASTAAALPMSVDWGLYDLGTYALRASQPALSAVIQGGVIDTTRAVNVVPAGASATVDVTAFITVPERSTWFLSGASIPNVFNPNQITADDLLGEQFTSPSPVGGSTNNLRITPYSRGLVPRPDPKDGLPVLAIVALAPAKSGAPNPQTQQTAAQISVRERARFLLP